VNLEPSSVITKLTSMYIRRYASFKIAKEKRLQFKKIRETDNKNLYRMISWKLIRANINFRVMYPIIFTDTVPKVQTYATVYL